MFSWLLVCFFFFFKQKTAYEMRISDWSSDVCSSDLLTVPHPAMTIRRFVLDPLRAIAPNWRHPLTRLTVEPGGDAIAFHAPDIQIGRASCRERVCQYV